MIKVLVNNEEVVCDNKITINEEMLSTSSTILRNCYPKAWELTKDYTSNYYFPKDYSKCKIIEEKEIEFEILGETTQDGTPSPSNPVPIVNKTGEITETIGGLPYQFNLGDIELCKIGNYTDYIAKSDGRNLFNGTLYNGIINQNGTYSSNTTRITNANQTLSNTFYLPKGTYTLSIPGLTHCTVVIKNENGNVIQEFADSWKALPFTFTTSQDGYLYFSARSSGGNLNPSDYLAQVEPGHTASDLQPYGNGNWYVYKRTNKVVLDGTENCGLDSTQKVVGFKINDIVKVLNSASVLDGYSNRYVAGSLTTARTTSNNYGVYDNGTYNLWLNVQEMSLNDFKTWLGTNNVEVIYPLATPTYEIITDEELIEQLNSVGEVLVFCGAVKNTGNISLNPREPHYVDLQILDFKTLLSEGETLNYVITDKTIPEAIAQVVASISDYGFIVGNINILNPNDKINAYSTLNKTAYDVFQYIADVTQSKWFTRVIDEDTIAIDFYDPTLMPQADDIEYTQQYFEDNDIEDMTFNYSTNDYRNKQIMTSDEVYANITQTETIIANGYQDSYMCQNKIGQITSITVNGTAKTFITKSEAELGLTADFEYQPGEMTFTANSTYTAGAIIVITYYAIVKGREIILNSTESNRIESQINRKGTISRYENRNDTTSSQELIKIGQSYIKYKGSAEITLTIKTSKNLFNVGQIVEFNSPLEELSTKYLVKAKEIEMIPSIDEIFYTFELSSNFNSENAINYFDNQRAKNQGNIGEGETITRNIDLESTALIEFYDFEQEEVVVINPTSLDFALDGVLI